MELTLRRTALRAGYTIGHLYIDGTYFCDTLEDTVRDLDHNGRFDNGEVKIPAQTAIPYGRYRVTMNVPSPRFAPKAAYKWWHPDGRYGLLPRLLDVPHFDGILIHSGNSAADTAGCILVGRNTAPGMITDSMSTCKLLYPLLWNAQINKHQEIWLSIE